MKFKARRLLWAGLVLLASFAGCGGTARPPEERVITYGVVHGVNDSANSGTYFWKGLPFAKPPVGALRWMAPVEPDPWSGVLQTNTFGNACIQYGRIYGPGSNNTYDATIGTTLNAAVGSEDCLTLNIWRPASDEANLPVVYFIYGGSDVSGYSADPVYDGATLANGNDDSGNFGTLDTIKTLQFINKNIASFGGNAGNVTVMGQSAGAINVYALMTSPLVVNANPKLFHKAIPISGGISLASNLPAGSIATLSPTSTYLAQGNALLNNLLIADGKATDNATAQAYAATQTNAQIASYLRSKDGSTLFTVLLTKLAALGLSGSGPIPEGTVLPPDPIAAIKAGNYMKVPVLASNTRDEAKLFSAYLALSPALGGLPGMIVTDASRFATMYSFNPDAATTLTAASIINSAYLPVTTPVTGYNAKTDLLNSIFFIASRDNVLAALKSQQDNVWYYQFNWDKEPGPWNDIYGAAHAFDLPFVFGNFGPSLFGNVIGGNANKAGRVALSNAMMKSVAAFAKNGDPNDAALGVTWPVWPKRLIFDATLTDKALSVQ